MHSALGFRVQGSGLRVHGTHLQTKWGMSQRGCFRSEDVPFDFDGLPNHPLCILHPRKTRGGWGVAGTAAGHRLVVEGGKGGGPKNWSRS